MTPYFSQRDFRAFVSSTVGEVKVSWLALAGETLDEAARTELERLLEDFFRARGNRSFRKHRAPQNPLA